MEKKNIFNKEWRMEEGWKKDGRRMEGGWKEDGRRMEGGWKEDGRRMEGNKVLFTEGGYY